MWYGALLHHLVWGTESWPAATDVHSYRGSFQFSSKIMKNQYRSLREHLTFSGSWADLEKYVYFGFAGTKATEDPRKKSVHTYSFNGSIYSMHLLIDAITRLDHDT